MKKIGLLTTLLVGGLLLTGCNKLNSHPDLNTEHGRIEACALKVYSNFYSGTYYGTWEDEQKVGISFIRNGKFELTKQGEITEYYDVNCIVNMSDKSVNVKLNKSNKFSETETNIVLNFELLTGSWKDIDQMDKERGKRYDNVEVQELSTDYFKSKSITFNQISKALEDTTYYIEYNEPHGDRDLHIVQNLEPWKLYDGDKLIGEGNNIGYFEKQGKHFILCYNGKDGHSCIIDGEVNTSPYIIDMQWALPKIYNGDIYKIKWLGYGKGGNLDKFGVYKNNEELYTFEAEHPTDTTVQSLVVDDSGWWVFYRTRNVGEEGIFFHLIHNGEDLGEINGREDIIGLNNYGGKAFYMYKKDGVIYYNLNGEDYKTEYEDIIHDLCCSPGMYNITFRNSAFTFYGKKDGEYSLIKGDFSNI